MDTIKINFDAYKKSHWSDQETANVKLLIDFMQTLMNDHDSNKTLRFFFWLTGDKIANNNGVY